MRFLVTYGVFYEVNRFVVVKLDERHIIEHLVKLLETLWDRIKVLDPFLTAGEHTSKQKPTFIQAKLSFAL